MIIPLMIALLYLNFFLSDKGEADMGLVSEGNSPILSSAKSKKRKVKMLILKVCGS
jgi:hypothetical protein